MDLLTQLRNLLAQSSCLEFYLRWLRAIRSLQRAQIPLDAFLDLLLALAAHLNTSSEAQTGTLGLPVPQGNNVILAAANAYDSAGKTRATLRVSARTEQGPTQTQIREFSRRSQAEIEGTLRPAAEATVKAMLQLPNVKSYKVTELRVDMEGPLTCMLTRFEGDYGGRLMVADTWVCPSGDKSIKLSTSYEKALKHIYSPTLDRVRRSLSTPTER